ncbi:MAG: type IV secretory system conjugative DNA transfer family protein [Pseudomonadota bacterium]|nr:type IV secretory system conjugative DNA transfer family protein [Pseudomonadota bacterium]
MLDLHLLKLAFLLQFELFWLGLLAGAFLIGSDLEEDSPAKYMMIGASFLAVLPAFAYLSTPWLIHRAGVDITPAPFGWFLLWLACAAGGLVAGLIWLRHGVSGFERLGKKFTKRSSLERNQRTDVREIDRFLPAEIGLFDPLKFIDERKGMFVGLNEDKRPVYIPYEDWKLSHVLLSGRTRSGKGVAAQILLTQAIRRKEFVIILDPKADAWMPHIFRREAEKCGQPYHFLDLRQDTHPQIDLFQGCDQETIENMLIAAFSLAEKGEAADFYRLKDRRAARETARYVADNPGATPGAILAEFGQHWKGEADGFAAAMQEMAELRAVNRADGQGIDIGALEQSGGCLYVVGDMGNTRIVRMQRMLLVRLMMLAKKRDYLRQEPRTITVFADEFKVHISRPFMTSLGAAAGWGMHCILAFQSLQDLADVPGQICSHESCRAGAEFLVSRR